MAPPEVAIPNSSPSSGEVATGRFAWRFRIRTVTSGENFSPRKSIYDRSFEGCLGGIIDVAIFYWTSVQLLLGFDAGLLCSFTAPIKVEGEGGERDVPSELLQPSLSF